MITDALTAAIMVGLPVFALSWYLFQGFFSRGELDASITGKDFERSVSKLGKAMKKRKTEGLAPRWIEFGGGFYGVGAVWTLIAVEAVDTFNFLTHFPGLSELLADGIVSLIVDFLLNQLENFIVAITWFLYWGDGSSIITYLAIGYVAYYGGVRLARTWSMDDLKSWIAERQRKDSAP